MNKLYILKSLSSVHLGVYGNGQLSSCQLSSCHCGHRALK